MECLACGHCCTHLSPITEDDVPCPHLNWEGDISKCAVYEMRPHGLSGHNRRIARHG